MSNRKVLLAALICGLLAAIAVHFYLKSVEEAAVNIKTKKVAVAAARIPARTLVTPDLISFQYIPGKYVHDGAVSDLSEAVGYTARAEIEAGEQILRTKLVPKEGTGPTLAHTVPLGMRAISISVTEQSGVSGLLVPGDRVDVMGTVDIDIPNLDPNTNNIKVTKTHLILQNVQVLAVGKTYTDPGAQQEDKKNPNQAGGNTVTLAVPADKMQFLVAVSDKGKLTLGLRSPADKSEEARPAMDNQQLLR